jgi:mRNA-degrading endonuclease toxin of MazEF toxin-antitoxin module
MLPKFAAECPRDPGTPRPARVIQSDLFNETHPTVTVLPVAGEIRSAPQMARCCG